MLWTAVAFVAIVAVMVMAEIADVLDDRERLRRNHRRVLEERYNQAYGENYRYFDEDGRGWSRSW